MTYNTQALNVDLAHQRYSLASIGGMRETFLGATVPLGATKLYGQYMTESTGSSNSMKGYGLGVSHTMGAFDLKAAYSRSALKSAAGANIGTTGRIALGVYYNLSKRTALFTQIVSVTNADGAANTIYPTYGAVTAANNGSRGYAFGVRHSF